MHGTPRSRTTLAVPARLARPLALIAAATFASGCEINPLTGTNGAIDGARAAFQTTSAANAQWCSASNMLVPRYQASATKLKDGRVLVVGGRSTGGQYLGSAELFDPKTGSWTTTGSLKTARYYHSATLMSDGRVLIAGGINAAGAIASVEVFDPRTETWTDGPSMNVGRREHFAGEVAPGRVVVAGGGDPSVASSSAELIDVGSGSSMNLAPLAAPQSNAAGITLMSGGFYIAGGYTNYLETVSTTQRFDPIVNQWSTDSPLVFPRDYLTLDQISATRLVAVGGFDQDSILGSIEVLDMGRGGWHIVGGLRTPRFDHRTAMLSSAMFVVGGVVGDTTLTGSVEVLDTKTFKTVDAAPLRTARYGDFLVVLNDGRVLVGGGASRFNAAGETWLSSVEVTCQSISAN
jgi:hypothetical protein